MRSKDVAIMKIRRRLNKEAFLMLKFTSYKAQEPFTVEGNLMKCEI